MAKIRNIEIKRLWRMGKTLQDIADEFGITKQRVHQLIFRQKDYGVKLSKLRKEVFKRDKFRCVKCGKKMSEVKLTINHIVPKIVGGTNSPTNLETTCYKCNRQEFAKLCRVAIKFYFEHNKPFKRGNIKIEKSKIILPKKLIEERKKQMLILKKNGFELVEIGKIFGLKYKRVCQILRDKTN